MHSSTMDAVSKAKDSMFRVNEVTVFSSNHETHF